MQEAVFYADLAIKFLRDQGDESVFESFLGQVIECATVLTNEPTLPRYARQSSRFDSPKAYFRKDYYDVLDLLCGELSNCFQQKRDMPIVVEVEKLLLNAVNASVPALLTFQHHK